MINSIIYLLEEAAKKFPDKAAYCDESSHYTFAQVRSIALKMAKELGDVGPNMPIAIFIPKSCKNIISFLAALYSGNFYVPVDVKNPKERVRAVFDDLQAAAVIVDDSTQEIVRELCPGKRIINFDSLLSKEVKIDHWYLKRIERVIDLDPMYCIYTSGSTGVPKGVLVSHRAALDYLNYALDLFKFDEKTIFANQAQFHFDVSLLDIIVPLAVGATTHIVPQQLFSFTAKLTDYLLESEINTIYWVPAVMNHIASSDALGIGIERYLKKVLFAGEVMPIKTLNYWRRKIPQAMFVNLYGPTEITVTCTHYIVDREFKDTDDLPIGVAIRNSDVLLLDSENRLIEKSNITDIGELCVRGSSLALGYWRDFEKTQKVFTQNPLNNSYEDKIYRTGDLVKYNDRGEIAYIGRKDNQIKHMGHRIELGDIERAINSLDYIKNVCVLYDKDKQAIVCFYVATSSSQTEVEIINDLKEKLPRYMTPSVFKLLDDMPISSAGKIDRQLLRKRYEGEK